MPTHLHFRLARLLSVSSVKIKVQGSKQNGTLENLPNKEGPNCGKQEQAFKLAPRDLETETSDVPTSLPHSGPSEHSWRSKEQREEKAARSHRFITVIRAHEQCSRSSSHPKSQQELLPRKYIVFFPDSLESRDLSLLLELEVQIHRLVPSKEKEVFFMFQPQ